MSDNQRIAVIGGGSWATALVKILCNNVTGVNWYMRSQNSVDHILAYKHNPKYLQSVEFDLSKITVSDNGVGIPKEKIGKIFVPYFTTKSTGTGLGLAMVKQIVENHGGTIDFESKVGEGTTFNIELPQTK